MSGRTAGTVNGSRLPAWLERKMYRSTESERIRRALRKYGLITVCQRAACPNCSECWGRGHLTVMILGPDCTRDCRFCNIRSLSPGMPDKKEPENVALMVRELSLDHIVITSVTRDDLTDKGAGHFSKVVDRIKNVSPGTEVELLIPDLAGEEDLVASVARSGADIIGHNIETPGELYGRVRPSADYECSIKVLKILAWHRENTGRPKVKSSVMVGLGEDRRMLRRCFRDLREAGVDILFLGQYLAPSERHYPVQRYYSPEEFEELARSAEGMGFRYVSAGPFVRSSYRAGLMRAALSG